MIMPKQYQPVLDLSASNPVLVHATRGELVENRHRGAIVVCDPGGRVVWSRGDIGAPVYPRSAIKALQALPLLETGAADHYALSAAEIALACSSHNAEPGHTDLIDAWLERLGLGQDALECGAHAPLHEPTARAMLLAGQDSGRIHNNCSGKHTGMLTTARCLGEDTRGYIEREHPAQQRWFDAVGEMGGVDMRRLPWSYDGCGIPVIAMPLTAIATAFARFAAPDDLGAARIDAVERITSAIAANPFMVAGSGRLCTDLMLITGRRVLVKTGADGVFTATVPGRGLGLALKIDDGNREAAEIALLAALHQLEILRDEDLEALAAHARLPILNTRGVSTGYRQAADF